MRVAIRTLQNPRRGAGAFNPTLTIGAAPATNGNNLISGAPGTVRVRSPRPASMNDGSWAEGYNQPSDVAPNWILPSIYTFHANAGVHFPGKILSDNVMPEPAINQTRSAAQTQHRFRIGGRTVTAAIRPFTTWPTYNGKESS